MAKEFERTLQDIDKRCRKHGIPYAVIGGMAAIMHGYARTTADVDVIILTEIDELERVLEIFSQGYTPLRPNPLAFFKRCLFVPLQNDKTKLRVDVAAALSGFEKEAIQRSRRKIFHKVEVSVCTVEDLLMMKLVAARAKDDLDLDMLMPLHRRKLDLKYLRARASSSKWSAAIFPSGWRGF